MTAFQQLPGVSRHGGGGGGGGHAQMGKDGIRTLHGTKCWRQRRMVLVDGSLRMVVLGLTAVWSLYLTTMTVFQSSSGSFFFVADTHSALSRTLQTQMYQVNKYYSRSDVYDETELENGHNQHHINHDSQNEIMSHSITFTPEVPSVGPQNSSSSGYRATTDMQMKRHKIRRTLDHNQQGLDYYQSKLRQQPFENSRSSSHSFGKVAASWNKDLTTTSTLSGERNNQRKKDPQEQNSAVPRRQQRRMIDLSQFKRTNQTKLILFYSTSDVKRDLGVGTGYDAFRTCPSSSTSTQQQQQPQQQSSDCYLMNIPHQQRHLYNLSRFDAVLFHPVGEPVKPKSRTAVGGRGINHRDNIAATTRRWRKPHQRFVLLYMESPVHFENRYLEGTSYGQYPHFFNWTMTYHWDSDIPRPYGWFRNIPLPTNGSSNGSFAVQRQQTSSSFSSRYPILRNEHDWISYNATWFRREILPHQSSSFHALARRPGQVAWVVSHCSTDSQRENYVRELQKYINVTVFGQCSDGKGNFALQSINQTRTTTSSQNNTSMSGNDTSSSTPPSPSQPVVWKDYNDLSLLDHVEQNYKFYLGFENAFCDDYVTEKLFTRMNRMVVIVLGQANYQRVAPPHSYINIMVNQTNKKNRSQQGADDNDDGNKNRLNSTTVPSFTKVSSPSSSSPSSWSVIPPKQLAKYLHYLSKNPDEYLSYFWWQQYYEVQPKSFAKADRMQNFAQSFCRLCEKLHQPSSSSSSSAGHSIPPQGRREESHPHENNDDEDTASSRRKMRGRKENRNDSTDPSSQRHSHRTAIEAENPIMMKSYSNISDWWRRKGQCNSMYLPKELWEET